MSAYAPPPGSSKVAKALAKKARGRIAIRASALPRIMACPESLTAPDILIETTSPEARMGRAVHAVLADVVRGGLEAVPELEPYAAKHAVTDLDELRMLSWAGVNAWGALREEIDPQLIEERLEGTVSGIALSGHADIIGQTIDEETGEVLPVVADWKTGYLETDYLDQLRAYLSLAWSTINRDASAGKAIVIWLRERRLEVVDVTSEDLAAWERDLAARLAHPTFGPGEHCTYCGRALECPARSQIVRSVVADLSDGEAPGALTPERLAGLYPRVKLVKRALDLYDTALREAVEAAGQLSTGDGRVLTLEDQRRETVLFERAATALALHLDMLPTDLRAALEDDITVSKKAIEDLAAARADRGLKGKARAEVTTMLREDGAMKATEFKRLVCKKGGEA